MLKFLLKRKIIIGLFIIFVFTAGFYSFNKLDKELFPAVDFSQTMILVETEEMPAEDVEEMITEPIENKLDDIEGIKGYESTSTMTASTFYIDLKEENADDISQTIENEVNQLQSDLYGVRELMVMQATTNAPYELFLDVSGADSKEMDRFTNDIVKPRLEDLSEVREVDVTGLNEYEVQIAHKAKKLKEHELTNEDITNAIQQTDQSATLGTFKDEDDAVLRWNTDLKDVQQIKDIPLATETGDISLSDVAKIKEVKKDQTAMAWKNGDADFLLLQVGRADGVSQIDMAEAVRGEIKEIESDVDTPAEIHEVAAQADYVDEAIDGVTSNIIIGGIIAVIVLLLFLRNFRATIIIGLSIPASILLTILTMTILDYSFNLLSLIGLGLGIGMIVDAAIVVLESIFQKKEQGFKPTEAVLTGTKEVAGAVISSALTTIVVFIPIVLMDEEVGKMVIVLTVVVAVTLISSVIVAFTLIPVLSENFLKVGRKKKVRFHLIAKYGALLSWITKKKRRRYSIIGLFLLMFISSFVLLTKIPVTFMPDILNRYAEVSIELEPGVTPKEREDVAQEINERFQHIEDIDSNIILDDSSGGLAAIVNMTPEEDKTMEQEEVNDAIFDQLNELEEDYPISAVASMMEGQETATLGIEISGKELDILEETGNDVVEELQQMDGITSANLSLGHTEKTYIIDVKEDAIDDANLSEEYLNQTISQYFSDQAVGELSKEGETVAIKLKSETDINNKKDLLKQDIITPEGEEELSKFISLNEKNIPTQIDHSDGERYVAINADFEGDNLASIHTDINDMLNNLELDRGYTASLVGDFEEQQQAATDLVVIFLISLFLVFVVMAIQFNSLKHPIIILFIIPVTLTGVLIGLFLTQKELNVLSAIGVIMLIGIVINNGILLIDRTKQLRNQDMDTADAIIASGKERIRPIFMTTLTTVGGMIPLALATGSSSGYQSPLAVVIISGLLFSTLITLILIPSIYLLFEDIHEGLKKLKRKKRTEPVEESTNQAN